MVGFKVEELLLKCYLVGELPFLAGYKSWFFLDKKGLMRGLGGAICLGIRA